MHLQKDGGLARSGVDLLSGYIRGFLSIAQSFSEERSEGRFLRFGFLLGQPNLFKHWQGEPLVRCECGDEDRFLSLEELRRQFQLTEDPGHRCIVIPYMERKLKGCESLPGYVLEFESFLEGLAQVPRTGLWSEEFRPYVLLYPALSLVAGVSSWPEVRD